MVESGREVGVGIEPPRLFLGLSAMYITSREIQDWLEEEGLTPLFPIGGSVFCDGNSKPAPEIYLEAARRAGVIAGKVCICRDNLKRDVTVHPPGGILACSDLH
jgi:FMN phosphatase YigB (HAD superfamily)